MPASITLSFAPLGAILLVTTFKEVALGTLQLGLRAVFAKMPFLLAVETFVFAACLDGINVHGIRVPCLSPFHHSCLNAFEKVFKASHLSEICLKDSVLKSSLGLPERLATRLDHNHLGLNCSCWLWL